MRSRLVVLGSCGAWPEPGRACSGYLPEHAGVRIVLDLGYGTLPRLLAELGSTAGDGIDAVIVSHAHPDHVVDLHGLFRARRYARRDGPPIPLYAPPRVVDLVVELEDGDRAAVDAARLGPVTVRDPGWAWWWRRQSVAAVVRGPGPADRGTRRDRAHHRCQLEDRVVAHLLDRGGELGPELR